MQPWFTAFATAIAEDEPFYRECTECGQPALPPREICPECGTRTLEDEPLSTTATVLTYTTISSTIPTFVEDTPYTVVIVAFDEGVRLTGQLRETESIVDESTEHDEAIELGDTVELGVEERDDGYWIVTFAPA